MPLLDMIVAVALFQEPSRYPACGVSVTVTLSSDSARVSLRGVSETTALAAPAGIVAVPGSALKSVPEAAVPLTE